MSQLIPNQGKTGVNGGPKWRQIWTFLKLLKSIAFYPNQIFFSQKFIGWYIASDKKIKNSDDMVQYGHLNENPGKLNFMCQ